MTDYTGLVKFLRGLSPWAFPDASKKRMNDAAAAIEALNRLVELNTERCEGLREQLRKAQEQYEKHLNELEQQLPKRGEWYKPYGFTEKSYKRVCTNCQDVAYFCGKGNYRYCPNCGAKMEVQDGKD